jgi:hypothetical protein
MIPLPTKEQLEHFRTLIIEACEAHIQSGGTIRERSFGGCNDCCPITCLVGSMETVTDRDLAMNIKLGFVLETGLMWRFIDAFDGRAVDGRYANPNPDTEEAKFLINLGMELRKKYIKDSNG